MGRCITKEIINMLRKEEYATKTDIMRYLKTNWETTKRNIKLLEELNIIENLKGRLYKLKDYYLKELKE